MSVNPKCFECPYPDCITPCPLHCDEEPNNAHEYYIRHKEKFQKYRRQYYLAHKEYYAAYNKAYKLRNKEKLKEQQKIYYGKKKK